MTLVLPRRRFQSISFAFQCISTIALVTLLFATPEVEALLPRIATVDHGLLRWLPTVWFLGLYQELAGGAAPAMHPLAARAVEALLAAGSASLLFYLASYQRCVRRIRESAESGAQKPGWLRTFGARWFDRYVLRRPFDRACFHFATSTLSRSRPHLLLMAGFAGLGMATALQYATAGWSVTPIGFGALPAATLLAPTLAISFFLLTGMRFVFDWPAELRANWTFQIVVEARMEAARRVARKLMSVLVIAPVSIASLILYGTICGIWIGLAEAGFLLLATLTLAEILLVDYAKIPFTSSYSGPKHNAGLTLAVYLLAFFLFSPGLAHLEHWTLTLRNPAPFLALIVLLATGWAGLSYFARARDRSGDQIIFSDEPEPALLSMDLR